MLPQIGKGLFCLVALPLGFLASFYFCYKCWIPNQKDYPELYGEYKGYWHAWAKNMKEFLFDEVL